LICITERTRAFGSEEYFAASTDIEFDAVILEYVLLNYNTKVDPVEARDKVVWELMGLAQEAQNERRRSSRAEMQEAAAARLNSELEENEAIEELIAAASGAADRAAPRFFPR